MLLFADALCAYLLTVSSISLGHETSTYSTFDKVKSVGLPGVGAAAEEAEREMQPLSSDDADVSQSIDAALE